MPQLKTERHLELRRIEQVDVQVVALSPAGQVPGGAYLPLFHTDIFNGWSNSDPGFDHVTQSAGGVGPLPINAQVWLECAQTASFTTWDKGIDAPQSR